MLKKTKCSHCVKLFQPIRMGHLFCSATCRKLQFKAKKKAESKKKGSRRLSNKLEKLSSSTFGKYLVREFKRSGTVQILKDHSSESLAELVVLKRRCTTAAGYKDGENLGAFELSHIYPVGSSKSKNIGLLNSKNLTIAPKEFNRQHSTKIPSCGYQGQYLSKDNLEAKWKVSDSQSSTELLQLARKYIGDDFDIWLSKHAVNTTQKQALIKQLQKVGFDKERLKDIPLDQLKSMAADEDVAYFHMSKDPENIRTLLIEELSRLDIGHDFAKAFELLDIEEWSVFYHVEMEFVGSDLERKEFEEFLIEQSLACLHGQSYSNKWREKAVLDCFRKIETKRESSPKPYQDEESDWIL